MAVNRVRTGGVRMNSEKAGGVTVNSVKVVCVGKAGMKVYDQVQ